MENFDLQKFGEGSAPAAEGNAPAAESSAPAEGSTPAEGSAPAEGAQEMSFRDLVKDPRYRDEYNSSVERAVKRRMDTQERRMLREMQPMLTALAGKYGIGAENATLDAVSRAVMADDTLLEERAADAGMTVDGYRRVQQAEAMMQRTEAERREAESRQRWQNVVGEAAAMGARYPGFTLESAMENEQFRSALASLQAAGFQNPVEAAYRAVNFDALMERAAREQAETAKQQISNDIQSGLSRPAENGAARAAATHKLDPRNLTREQRAEIRKRLAKGEKIHFGK